MAEVIASIAGRQFRLACEDGQEDHLQTLAKEVDERIAGLRDKFGEIGNTRLTVMAALTLVDELAETNERLRQLAEEAASLQDARAADAARTRQASDAVIHAFNSAAERLEGITKKLNATHSASIAIG